MVESKVKRKQEGNKEKTRGGKQGLEGRKRVVGQVIVTERNRAWVEGEPKTGRG